MRIPKTIKTYGNTAFRGACPREESEQIAFFAWLKLKHPDYYAVAFHPKNEGAYKEANRYGANTKDVKMGRKSGASDIIILGSQTFVCELKRQNHTKSSISAKQLEFLESAHNSGCFSCLALGFDGAKLAFKEWLSINK